MHRSRRRERTNLLTASVKHIAELHHSGVATGPDEAAVDLLDAPRQLEKRDSLCQVAVYVAHLCSVRHKSKSELLQVRMSPANHQRC